MPRIFISYRRKDSPYAAHLIYKELIEVFGDTMVYFDVESIPPGAEFEKDITDALRQSSVLFVVIGNKWLQEEPKGPFLLNRPSDYVRFEMVTAIRFGVEIIPVLVDNAAVPSANDLPVELKTLPTLNHVELRSGAAYDGGMRRILRNIDRTAAFIPKWTTAHGRDQFGEWVNLTVADIDYVMRWIPPGSCHMGSPSKEPGHADNENLHWVTMSSGFWLGQTAVTQALWQAVTHENPSHFSGHNLPVDSVSWNDVTQRFLPALAELGGDYNFCLPTEAQWEYACRAGSATAYSFGDAIDEQLANYNSNAESSHLAREQNQLSTVDVYRYSPNPWGLYQMHGNIWEWCLDSLREYVSVGEVIDPVGRLDGKRALRGGAWQKVDRFLRAAYRNDSHPEMCFNTFGFRLCCCV